MSGAVWLATAVVSFCSRTSPVGTYCGVTWMPGCVALKSLINDFNAGWVAATKLCQNVRFAFELHVRSCACVPRTEARLLIPSTKTATKQDKALRFIESLQESHGLSPGPVTGLSQDTLARAPDRKKEQAERAMLQSLVPAVHSFPF